MDLHFWEERSNPYTSSGYIAADVGVSAATVVSFGDKESLLIEVFDEWISSVHQDRAETDTTSDTPIPRHDAPVAILDLILPFIAHFARDPALSKAYASAIVGGTHESVIFRDLALSLVAEIETTLARTGFDTSAAARGARVVYFADIGIITSGNNRDSSTESPLDQLNDVIAYVVRPPEGDRAR